MTEKQLHDFKRKYGFSSLLEKSMLSELKTSFAVELEEFLYKKGQSSSILVFNVNSLIYGIVDQESNEFVNIITGERYPILKSNSNFKIEYNNISLLDLDKKFVIDYRIDDVLWNSLSDEQYSVLWKNYKQFKKSQPKSQQKIMIKR